MIPAIASSLLPLMRLVDPETAHQVALRCLRVGLAGATSSTDDPLLSCSLAGMPLSNPIGLAAGFDKDGIAVTALLRLGFGAVELGTVTPLPQFGNNRPRLFRLEDGAVINRMGMNNQGLAAFTTRLAKASSHWRPPGTLIGANVGINNKGADPERDYPALVAAVSPHADYIALNISSPNTTGLRGLQAADRLCKLLSAVVSLKQTRPVFVKVAPDLSLQELEQLVDVAISYGVAGLIVSNTTVDRPNSLRGRHVGEAGGLSGPPLMAPSTAMLARAWRLSKGKLVLIGCGGVTTGRDVLAKLQAGAQMVQLYAAFAVQGPALIPRLKMELAAAMREKGLASVAEAIGTQAEEAA